MLKFTANSHFLDDAQIQHTLLFVEALVLKSL